MSHTIPLDDNLYISTRRASELSGYSPDYIGQLARAGRIAARRVGGQWKILRTALESYLADAPSTPIQDVPAPVPEDDRIIGLDGVVYSSAPAAAKEVGYHVDYIGQLARKGAIAARRVGERWYVDIGALREHRRNKDRLLAEVQSESVGLRKQPSVLGTKVPIPTRVESPETHFRYVPSLAPLLPLPSKKQAPANVAGNTAEEFRVVPIRRMYEVAPAQVHFRTNSEQQPEAGLSIFTLLFPLLLVPILFVVFFNVSTANIFVKSLATIFPVANFLDSESKGTGVTRSFYEVKDFKVRKVLHLEM